jgi:predicted phosphohydrolase
MKKYVWLSDTHLNMSILPFLKRRFINKVNSVESDGLIMTGDISNGMMLESDLKYLATHYDGPIYFVLGNHDYYWRHRESVESDVRRLCRRFPNLLWLSDEDPIQLDHGVSLVGDEGWFDVTAGRPELTKWCIDRLINLDYLQMANYGQQAAAWKQRAKESTSRLCRKIRSALEDSDVVYVATHFPPWGAATMSDWKLMEDYWLSYNTNVCLGEELESLMKDEQGRIVVLSGHTHMACEVSVSKNITCKVAAASYWGKIGPEELVFM